MDIIIKLIGITKMDQITRGPYALLVTVLLVSEALLGFWFVQAEGAMERYIIGGIMTLILLALLFVVLRITPIIPPEPVIITPEPAIIPPEPVIITPEPTVEFCNKENDVKTNMIDLLHKTKESLYYYGGAGFIGTFQEWQEELDKKIKIEKIIFVRLIDLKTPTEIKKVLEMMKEKEDVDRDYTKYKEWLKMHSKYLNIPGMLNEFYNFEGAPLWRYGVHHIIFDEKHVAIVFLSTGDVRNAIIIRHCPDIAKALIDSIGGIVEIFNLTPITDKELEKVSGSRR